MSGRQAKEHKSVSVSAKPWSGKVVKATKETLRVSHIICTSKCVFETAVDASSGFKVAAVDNAQPSLSVTRLAVGTKSKPGVAHALSNFAFKVRFLFFYINSCATRG